MKIHKLKNVIDMIVIDIVGSIDSATANGNVNKWRNNIIYEHYCR